MKLALRYIPTESWVDVFILPWITRKQLGEIVHRFRNRKFVEILQYCLHERGKRTLEDVHLNKDAIIPREPLPENIKFFDWIIIRDFDSLALDFLRRISPLFISNDVNLNLWSRSKDDLPNRTVFDHLAPLLHGIHSLTFDDELIPLVEQYFGPKLAQIKMLEFRFSDWPGENDQATTQAIINFVLSWLTSGGQDPTDEPKLLVIYNTDWRNFYQFSMAIKEQFLSAKRLCTFAIKYEYSPSDEVDIDFGFNLDLQNSLGEQLHGKFNEDGEFDEDGNQILLGDFQILRHQPNAGGALQEWVEETDRKYGINVIDISEELTIGPIDANAGANEVDETGEEEEDGPSTSKQPKLT